jgi:hypothetical protein
MPTQKQQQEVKLKGAWGFLSFPAKLFAPAISKWIIPGIGISIGIYVACEGIAKIISAVGGIMK